MKEPQHVVHEHYREYRHRKDKAHFQTWMVFGIGMIVVGLYLLIAKGYSSFAGEAGLWVFIAGVIVSVMGYGLRRLGF